MNILRSSEKRKINIMKPSLTEESVLVNSSRNTTVDIDIQTTGFRARGGIPGQGNKGIVPPDAP